MPYVQCPERASDGTRCRLVAGHADDHRNSIPFVFRRPSRGRVDWARAARRFTACLVLAFVPVFIGDELSSSGGGVNLPFPAGWGLTLWYLGVVAAFVVAGAWRSGFAAAGATVGTVLAYGASAAAELVPQSSTPYWLDELAWFWSMPIALVGGLGAFVIAWVVASALASDRARDRVDRTASGADHRAPRPPLA